MPEYNPADLPAYVPAQRPAAGVLRVTLPPGGTLAHVAAQLAEGAGAFGRIAEANGILDPIPHDHPPRRAVRRLSLVAGQEVIVPEGGVL